MTGLRRHLTYANVMATIAVFLALAGVSWAAATLGRNAVKGRNIATGAVGSRAVLDRSLQAKDFRPGQLAAGLKGEKGLQGPPGAAGAAGRDGAAIAASANGDGIVVSTPTFAYTTLPLELRWNQPAGTLDELRGVATVSMNGCAINEQLALQVVRDGLEISPDTPNASEGTANGPPDNDIQTFITKTVLVGQPFVESVALPVELPWTDAAGEHTVTLRVRENCSAPGPGPTFEKLRLWVVRAAG